ncbi:E3 ubiquitin-protein ligase TRIM39-like isoform X2 [Rhineura floridana]|uniref:E3 ubiquitin-protein ligase TRIM39-like isoform X2 n=1 Tax=Rhineura floridana TaxID=261503 RepID=UPI002AC86A4A|nr:E3 ubiquitin-protein ligase TRIM39-like isoform X2 [Rhineura floridana]
MATEGSLKELFDAMTCPICLGHFKDPVLLDCGHNFCKACIGQPWAESAYPECRRLFQPMDGRPNWQVGKVVQLANKLREEKRRERNRDVCKRHQKPLKLFCKDDEAPLCVACKRTKAHKGHHIALLEEVGRELKEKTQAQLKAMEEGKKNLGGCKMTQEPESSEWLLVFHGQRWCKSKMGIWQHMFGHISPEAKGAVTCRRDCSPPQGFEKNMHRTGNPEEPHSNTCSTRRSFIFETQAFI